MSNMEEDLSEEETKSKKKWVLDFPPNATPEEIADTLRKIREEHFLPK